MITPVDYSGEVLESLSQFGRELDECFRSGKSDEEIIELVKVASPLMNHALLPNMIKRNREIYESQERTRILLEQVAE